MATFNENSRYKDAVITDLKDSTETFVILKKFPTIPLSDNDKAVKITEATSFRPDLLSNLVYGTPDFGWALLLANNLRSFAELGTGLKLRVPPLDLIKKLIVDKDFSTI